jgi:hypothetical protein
LPPAQGILDPAASIGDEIGHRLEARVIGEGWPKRIELLKEDPLQGIGPKAEWMPPLTKM